MHSNSEVAAIAQLDEICDRYERAARAGLVDLDADPKELLAAWLEGVSSRHQSWLYAELESIRMELAEAACTEGEVVNNSLRAGMDSAAWQAVDRCLTFTSLPVESKCAIAAKMVRREFAPGEYLVHSGQQAAALHLIIEGQVQIFNQDSEGLHRMDTDGPGSVLGEMSLLTGYPCAADVIAETAVSTFAVDSIAIDSLIKACPKFEIAIGKLVSQRLGSRHRDALCGKSLGGYIVERCIGNGAMGVVYAARGKDDGVPRALKMLRHSFIRNTDAMSRFERETEYLSQLAHHNIVRLIDHFVAYRTRFIVLELFEGTDLRSLLRRRSTLASSEVRRILGQVAAGLHHAHTVGILHLDLKPANLLIDRSGRVAITDFGLSRLIEADDGDTHLVGTPAYMPPEQFLMEDIGPHSDWYAFGCIAYELITGQPLISEGSSAQLLEKKYRKPTSSWPPMEASEELASVVRAAIHPDPGERRLDLETIAGWGGQVPLLVSDYDISQ